MSRFDERPSTLIDGRSRARRSFRTPAALLLATTALTCPVLIKPAFAQSTPTGGSVAAGSVSIAQPSATHLTITQSSQSAVVNWQSFSIGQGSSVDIIQPSSSSAILNRVTGNTPSTIAGSLTANGQVYLVNPNGIAITKSGTVVTAGFVASTLGISDSDFMNGKRTFTGTGASAEVSNAGSITVGRGGYAALIGGTVSNSGSISVPLGKVGLGSGEQATLDFSGDGFLQVAAPTNAGSKGALIKNAGSIKADGGSVIISAATAREAARNAINISGLVQARSIGGHNGSIVIGGGAGGSVRIAGRLDAGSRHDHGGTVTLTGQQIKLKGANVDASGKTGGGTIKIGGDVQGGGTLQQAQSVTMDAATSIRADSTGTGNGGEVVLWSTGATAVRGLITAIGGPNGGNGGSIETSGHTLDFTGVTVNTSAPVGKTGSWLLDPTDLTVDAAAATTINGNLAATNVTLQTTATTTSGPGTTSSGSGDINIYAAINWSSANTLTLSAYNSINIVSSITATGNGTLALTTNNNIGGSNSAGALNFLSGGNVELLGSSAALTINGTSYTLIHSVTDLVNVNNNLSGTYALAGPLDLGGHTYTDGVIAPSTAGSGFLGTFNGLGNTISNLTINAPTSGVVGLFGQVGTGSNNSVGTVGNLVLSGGSVTAGATATSVGALAGSNTGTVFNVSASTSVTATATGGIAGGLVGYNWGKISNSHASGNVTDTVTGSWVGGLVGYNDGYSTGDGVGTITNAYATGTVTGGGGTGGVGTGSGAGSSTGGLVGINLGTVTNVYSAGAVHGGASSDVGGLIGQNDTTDGQVTVTNAYWDTTTSGISSVGTGAGTGLTTSVLKNGSLPSGFSSSIWSAVSGLYPFLGPKVITVNLSSQTATYGTTYSLDQTSAAYSETLGGTALTGGSFVNLSGLSITVAGTGNSSGTTTSTNAGNYLLSGSEASASGYIITYGATAVDLTVNPLAVTLTGSRTYNGGTSIAAGSLTLTNGVSGATAASIGLTGTGTVASANVSAGAQALNLTGLSVSNSNYTVTGGSGTATINPLAVTLTGSQTYNGLTTVTAALTASNKVSGDTLTVTGTPTGTLASANAGAEAMSSLSGLSLSNSNYTLTGGTGTVTVNPLAVTLTGTQTYNGLTGALASGLTVTNAIAGDTVGLAGTGVLASKNAGSEALTSTAGALSGLSVSNSNYTVTGASGTVDVLRLALSGTIGTGSSTYGSTLAPGTANFTNAVAGDALGTATIAVNTAGLTSTSGHLTAGTHTGIETVSGLSGADAGNYTFAGVTGNYTVTPLALGGTIGAGSSTYGSALAPGTASLTGSIGGDVLGTATVGVNTAGLTSTSGHLIAGTHTGIETVNALGGADASNYTFASVTGTYTVSPLSLSGTIGAGSSTYGSTLAPGAANFTNAIAGDVLGTATVGVNTAGLTSTSGHLIAGTHSGIETVSALSGADAGNYTFASVTGTYTVSPLALSGTIGAGSSTYGSALAPGALTLTNTVTGDVVAGGAVTVNTAGLTSTSGHLTAGTHPGIESVGSSLSGADAANYTFAGATGNYTVSPLALGGTIGAGSSTYGATLAPGVANLTGAIAGDVLGTATIGVNSAGLTSTSGHLIAGTHGSIETISALSGADGGNYSFAGITGSYTVTPLALAGTIGVGSSTYGSALAPGALTFTNSVTGDIVTGGAVTVNTAGQTSTSGHLTAGTHTGIESVGNSLSGADAANYTFTTGATGNYTVNALSVTLAGTRTYNGLTDAPASGLTVTNVIAGDTVGVSGTGVLASKNAGAEALTSTAGALSGLTVSNSNYTVTGGTGTVAVTPASITVTAVSGTSVYGSSPANPGLSATGLQNGENVSVLTGLSNSFGINSTSSVAGSPYALSVVGVLSNPNYTVTTRIAGSWTVTVPPSTDSALLASSVVRDSFEMQALPNNAKPVFAAAGAGTGTFYADPHFGQAYVCFGGGGGTAQSCTVGGNGAH